MEITYRMQDGYQVPNLLMPQERSVHLGKYAELRRQYLMKHRRVLYINLKTSCRLTEHLARLFVAHRRDRAGVDNVGVRRLLKIHQCMSAVQKLLLECLRFILVHLAPEGADRNFHVCLYPFPRFGR